MAGSNLEIALRYTAEVNARRVPVELLAPDVRIENATTAVTDRTYVGADGVREWIGDIFDVLDEYATFEAEPVEARDDYVLARIQIAGQGALSGAPVSLRFYGVMWLRDGKITRIAGYNSRGEALRAVAGA
jgi:ketosteroid isomerase-like protein